MQTRDDIKYQPGVLDTQRHEIDPDASRQKHIMTTLSIKKMEKKKLLSSVLEVLLRGYSR